MSPPEVKRGDLKTSPIHSRDYEFPEEAPSNDDLARRARAEWLKQHPGQKPPVFDHFLGDLED